METFMISGVGRYVAVGMAGDIDESWMLPGFAISTKAMLEGAGVAGFAQLENISAHTITMTECRTMYFTSYLNIKIQIPGKSFLFMRQAANRGCSEGTRFCPGKKLCRLYVFAR